MRRFKTTPEKKTAGMVILFVFIPIFLLWYLVFFLDNKPGLDTGIIIVAVAALLIYLYLRYKKQVGAASQNPEAALPPEADELDEEFPEGEEPVEEMAEPEQKNPKNPSKPRKQK
jgi:Ca2+/Na+ antiporter